MGGRYLAVRMKYVNASDIEELTGDGPVIVVDDLDDLRMIGIDPEEVEIVG